MSNIDGTEKGTEYFQLKCMLLIKYFDVENVYSTKKLHSYNSEIETQNRNSMYQLFKYQNYFYSILLCTC